LPVLFDTQPLSYLDLLTVQIWEIGLSYAIVRYGFMVVSPQSAAASILSTMADGLILTDPDGYIVGANAALYELLRENEKCILRKRIETLLPGAFLHQDLRTLLASENVVRGMEATISSSNGTDVHVSISASVVSDKFGRKTGYVTLLHDISERKRTERQLHFMATHDVLTNLPNRTVLNDRLRNALVRAKRYRQLVGILFVDVDNFKNINDMFGHDTGDIVLKEVADKLSISVRECDTVTRIGGDEFVIILTDLDDQSGSEVVVERIRAAFNRPLTVGRHDIAVTLSIGGSIYPGHAENVEDLYKCADLALYRVKESGRNGCQFYSLEIDTAARKSMKLEQEQLEALRNMRRDVSTELTCDAVQGYLFSRPVTSDTAAALLDS
jgi:diguanylate cyclase (GGDEF)-like protein/PAS domain S-box-containing protein